MPPEANAMMWALVALLVWVPLPLASNRPWAVAVMALASWGLVAWRVVRHRRAGAGPLLRAEHAWPLGALGLFAGLVGLQWLSTTAWGLSNTGDVFQTRLYLLTALAYLGGLLMVLMMVNTPQRATMVLTAVLGSAAFQSALGVLLLSRGRTYQYLFTDFPLMGRVAGSFANPDHLAGYLELGLAAGLGLLLAQLGQAQGSRAPAGWQRRLDASLGFLLSGKMLLRLVLVVLVVGLVMTHSRGGNGAVFLALLVMGGVLAAASKQLRKPALWLVASMALVDLVIIGQWVGLDRVVERLSATAEATAADAQATPGQLFDNLRAESSVQQRLEVPMLSLPLIAQAPWLGSGGGTYYLVFPSIKPAGFPHLWDHAHNDFVEIAVDTGLLGLGLLLLFAAATAWRASRWLRDGAGSRNRGVAVAALMALFCLGVHGVVDFNLQIPSNAFTLVVMMGLVWAMPGPKVGDASEAAPQNARQ